MGIAVYGAVDAAGRAAAIANGSSGPSVAAAGVGAAQLTAAVFALIGGTVAAASFPQVQAGLMKIVGFRGRAFPVGMPGDSSGGRS